MSNAQAIQSLIEAADDIELGAIKLDLAAVIHKLRHPMKDIIAKVPGDTMLAKARMIGVSRQTMYVWTRETTRPNPEQAAVIATLTGIPTTRILANGYRELGNDARTKAAKKAARVDEDGDGLPARTKRARSKRGRVVLKQGRSRHDRTAGKRTRRRAGKSVNASG